MTIFIVLALIIPLGFISQWTKIPSLIYYLLAGIILGPYGLKIINFNQEPLIRSVALVTIMLRSGLGLSLKSLKEVGKPAVLMSFIPGVLEATSISIVAMLLFDFSLIQSFILGFMLAAVSPAVVVPAMLNLQDKNLGGNLPTMILASSAVDDVVALSFFTFFTSLYFNQAGSLLISLLLIPVKMGFSFIVGYFLVYLMKNLKKYNIILVVLVAIIVKRFEADLPITALILIMSMGISLSKHAPASAKILSKWTKHFWKLASIFLFVSVGAQLNILALKEVYVLGLILIIIGLVFRSIGVILSASSLSKKERIFSVFAFMPKATVQAALASVPLSMGIVGGEIMLLLAVLSIIFTTPIGASLISIMAPKLLDQG